MKANDCCSSIGKQVSLGNISLLCLSLPIHLRYRPEFTFIAGIIPGPGQPSTNQIDSVLRPLLTELKSLWNLGIKVKTLQHPGGRIIRCALVCLTSDLPAAKKVAGLGSHASNFPCAYCYIRKSDLHQTDLSFYVPRSKGRHMKESLEWKRAATKKLKEQIFRETGVRWSGLNELEYWDPTKMIILDLMHNLAGIIEYHMRDLMKLEEPHLDKEVRRIRNLLKTKRKEEDKERKEKKKRIQLEEELKGLQAEAEELDDIMEIEDLEDIGVENELFCALAGQQIELPEITTEDLTESVYQPSLLGDNEEDAGTTSESDYNSDSSESGSSLEDAQQQTVTIDPDWKFQESLQKLKALQEKMSQVVVPSWIQRPPRNFGNPSHGKLKFDTWFKILQIFLPLVASDIWKNENTSPSILSNIYDLVSITNLLVSKRQTPEHPTALRHFIPKYVNEIQILYEHCVIKPNHHYALHYPELISNSGPSSSLEVWSGERTNHRLGSVKTNKQICE